jgi:Leucine Rich repeat
LQACRLGDAGTKELCPALLLGNTPIVSLNLAGNAISDEGAEALGLAIHRHPTLLDLFLSWNCIADAGARAIARVLPHSSIRTLDIGGLAEGRGGGRGDRFLQTEYLEGVINIGDQGCSEFAHALSQCTLEKLVLSRQHRISSLGILELSRNLCILTHHRHLLHLELQRIPVDDAGAIAMAMALPRTQLETLDLTINQIGNRGGIALARCIAVHPTLQHVGLTHNALGLDGLAAMAEAAAVNTTLRGLEVYGHVAGKEGSRQVWKIKPWLKLNQRTRRILDEPEGLGVLLCPTTLAKMGELESPTRVYLLVKEIAPAIVSAWSFQ